MSRAFTKELDDEHATSTSEKPISAARNLVTLSRAQKIEGEIASAIDKLARTEDGAKRAALERDLRYWETRKSNMEIVEAVQPPTQAGFGVTVSIERDGKPRN